MKTAVFVKAGQMAIETIEKPSVIEVDDAIIRVVRACVCGSICGLIVEMMTKLRIQPTQVTKLSESLMKLALLLIQ